MNRNRTLTLNQNFSHYSMSWLRLGWIVRGLQRSHGWIELISEMAGTGQTANNNCERQDSQLSRKKRRKMIKGKPLITYIERCFEWAVVFTCGYDKYLMLYKEMLQNQNNLYSCCFTWFWSWSPPALHFLDVSSLLIQMNGLLSSLMTSCGAKHAGQWVPCKLSD